MEERYVNIFFFFFCFTTSHSPLNNSNLSDLQIKQLPVSMKLHSCHRLENSHCLCKQGQGTMTLVCKEDSHL